MLGKSGKTNPWPIIVLVLAVLFLFQPDIANFFGPGAEPTPTTPPAAGLVCPVDTTALGFSASDADDPGSVIGVNIRYWVEALPQGVVNSTSSPTVSPTDNIAVWFAAGDTTYYGSYYNTGKEVPCKGTFDVPGTLWTKDSSITMTVYDEDNDLAQTGAANNQSIGIGENVEMRIRVKGNHESYYGNPEVDLDNLLAAEFSRTEIDSVVITLGGQELASAAVPTVEDSATGFVEEGFLMPKIAGSGSDDYYIIIQADAILNPDDDITLKIYDSDYFYNSETGSIEVGWEDENNADIGETTEPTATVYLS